MIQLNKKKSYHGPIPKDQWSNQSCSTALMGNQSYGTSRSYMMRKCDSSPSATHKNMLSSVLQCHRGPDSGQPWFKVPVTAF